MANLTKLEIYTSSPLQGHTYLSGKMLKGEYKNWKLNSFIICSSIIHS